MRTTPPTLLSLLLFLLLACSQSDILPADSLAGTWAGNSATAQVGDCTWGSAASVAVSATWQVTGQAVKATFTQQGGQVYVITTMLGTLTGSKVTLSEAQHGVCFGVPRNYSTRYEGEVKGKELTLVGLDTICPVQRCIFRRTITLTRQ